MVIIFLIINRIKKTKLYLNWKKWFLSSKESRLINTISQLLIQNIIKIVKLIKITNKLYKIKLKIQQYKWKNSHVKEIGNKMVIIKQLINKIKLLKLKLSKIVEFNSIHVNI